MELLKIFNIKAFLKSLLAFACCIALCILCFASLSFANTNVLKVRTGIQDNDSIRIVIETDKYKKENISNRFLTDKDRFVVDMLSSTIAKNDNLSNKQNSFIEKIRQNQIGKKAQIVLDLKKKLTLKKSFVIEPSKDNKNYRLVYDLKTSDINTSSKNEKSEIKVFKPTKKKKNFIVVLDPGHGGKDPGAIGKRGTKEKDIVLKIAINTKRELEKDSNITVIMTRNNDRYIPLKERAKLGEKINADLFISIHADSIKNPKVKGFSIYTLSEQATDNEAAKLAEKENAADLIGLGSEFKNYNKNVISILGDLAQTEVNEDSSIFAKEVVRQIKADRKLNGLLYRPHRQAPFAVLKSSIPSILVESGYLSNLQEEKLLNQLSYRRELGKVIANAAKSHLKKHSK